MIHHLSIAVKNPEHVAGVLTKLMGGWSRPFRMYPGSYQAFQLDDNGTQIEIYPAGLEIQPVSDRPGGLTPGTPRDPAYGPTHFALSVRHSEEEVYAIMAAEDWLCRRNDRAEFPVIEVWIENAMMFEVLPPDFAAKYLEVTQQTKREVLAERTAAAISEAA
ncbi:hypothetical protein [Sphingomonas bacterium]|uniref:hypothetical protein n=1 Tax=Sphingomonas bacterium TaxID=1895847 RepID=UPI00157711E9|nr:hypothetical protein [Sphingomonas bacterium]